MTTVEVLWECFRHFIGLDESNAAIHCAPTKFSPITFRVAEVLAAEDDKWSAMPMVEKGGDDVPPFLSHAQRITVLDVLSHKGKYEEDTGR